MAYTYGGSQIEDSERAIYERTVKNASEYMDIKRKARQKFTLFDASTMLAVVWGITKEQTAMDLTAFRGGDVKLMEKLGDKLGAGM